MSPSAFLPRTRALPLAVIAVVGLLALAGCGDDDESDGGSAAAPAATSESSGGGGGGGGETLKISADPGGALKFTTDSLTAKAGEVTIEMANPSSVPHAVAVEGNGVDEDGETVEKDGTSTVTVTLEAGEYTFYCPVDGHEAAGMKGTLTVS